MLKVRTAVANGTLAEDHVAAERWARGRSAAPPDTPNFWTLSFVNSGLMVNVLDRGLQQRDTRRMSPHHQEDFEQGSLVLEGRYTHHLRWPWIPDMTQWRADEHATCGAPSLTVIPLPAIHTSRAETEGQIGRIQVVVATPWLWGLR